MKRAAAHRTASPSEPPRPRPRRSRGSPGWSRAVAVMVVAQVAGGCATVTGSVIEHRRKHATLLESHVEQTLLPDSTSVAVAGLVVGESLEVSTRFVDQCQVHRVQTIRNREVATYELPGWHWALLGGGLALGGGGAATWVVGEGKIPPETAPGDLAKASAEQDRDLGRTLVPVGMGLVAAGVALLVSELLDGFLSMEDEVSLQDTQETLPEGLVACQGRPAPGVEVVVKPAERPKRRVTHVKLDTDAEGEASLKVLKSGLAHFPYGRPWVQLDCQGCEPSLVNLSAEAGADLAHKGGRKADLDAWLDEHRGHPETERLEELRREIIAHKAALRRLKPSVQARAVEDHLWDNRFREAWEAGALCVEAHPRHEECQRALKEAEGWYLEHLVKSGRNHLRWGDPQRSLYVARRCLEVKPGYGVCVKLKAKAKRSWTKAKGGLRYRIQEIAYRQGKSRIISEFKLRKSTDYVRVGISVFSNGRPICTDTREAWYVSASEIIVQETLCAEQVTGVENVVMRIEEFASAPTARSSDGPTAEVRDKRDYLGGEQDPGGGVAPAP